MVISVFFSPTPPLPPTLSATTFVSPNYPCQLPQLPDGSTTAVTGSIVRRHSESTRARREFENVSTAIKNQLTQRS